MTVSTQGRQEVFISYSHRDKKWLDRLMVHLKPLERAGLVAIWADTRIGPGRRWRVEIKQAIESANVAILLVSADFLASDFIMNNELPPLLQAADNRGVTISPLLLSPCLFEETETLAQFQAVNKLTHPLIQMAEGEQEALFHNLSKQILEVILAPFFEFRDRMQKKLNEIEGQLKPVLHQIDQDSHLLETDKGVLIGLWKALALDRKRTAILDALEAERQNSTDQRVQAFLDAQLRKLQRDEDVDTREFEAHMDTGLDRLRRELSGEAV